LLALQELIDTGAYDHIVLDTAPFGHALRLFELPSHLQPFLDFLSVAAGRDAGLAERFAGRRSTPADEFVARWYSAIEQVKNAFSSRDAGFSW
jgi:anion-transporting  ArsA/GET3 family ATPase